MPRKLIPSSTFVTHTPFQAWPAVKILLFIRTSVSPKIVSMKYGCAVSTCHLLRHLSSCLPWTHPALQYCARAGTPSLFSQKGGHLCYNTNTVTFIQVRTRSSRWQMCGKVLDDLSSASPSTKQEVWSCFSRAVLKFCPLSITASVGNLQQLLLWVRKFFIWWG